MPDQLQQTTFEGLFHCVSGRLRHHRDAMCHAKFLFKLENKTQNKIHKLPLFGSETKFKIKFKTSSFLVVQLVAIKMVNGASNSSLPATVAASGPSQIVNNKIVVILMSFLPLC